MSRQDPSATAESLYVQIYPSTLEGASRMEKIARGVHAALNVDRTELAGIAAGSLPRRTVLAGGVDIVRLGGVDRPGTIGRILKHLLWQPRVYLRYRQKDLRIVAAHNVWVLPLCWLLSRTTGALLVYNPHELETETASMRGAKQVIARVIEARLIKKCAIVSVVNSLIGDWYETRYGISSTVILPNLPEIHRVPTRVREELGIPDHSVLFVHTGHLCAGRNIPAILDAFAGSEHHVVFFGDGHYKRKIVDASQAHPNIHWHAPVAPEQIVSHIEEADAGLCLIALSGSLSDQLATPNKLMEALVADRPVLCTDFAEARTWMGPSAERWIVSDVAELRSTLAGITKFETQAFRGRHPQIPTWDSALHDLTNAYLKLSTHRYSSS